MDSRFVRWHRNCQATYSQAYPRVSFTPTSPSTTFPNSHFAILLTRHYSGNLLGKHFRPTSARSSSHQCGNDHRMMRILGERRYERSQIRCYGSRSHFLKGVRRIRNRLDEITAPDERSRLSETSVEQRSRSSWQGITWSVSEPHLPEARRHR